MFVSELITVPAQTPASNPVNYPIKLGPGTLVNITIRPAIGPRWEVYVKVEYRELCILPLKEDEWIPLEQYPIEAHYNWGEWDGTYTVNVLLCSPQARFSHDIVVEITVNEKASTEELLQEFIDQGL